MNFNTPTYFGLGICVALMAGCHDNSGSTPNPGSALEAPQALDTAQVLALAAKTSEIASPFAVNGGLITFTDTSETSSPVAVNGM